MKFSLIILFMFFLSGVSVHSEIRYVSKSGSSTAPYTSWKTAGNLITPVMNVCNYGDTIYVASGVYADTVKFRPGVALIGSGMDSCVIDISSIPVTQACCAKMVDNCSIEGFTIKSYLDPYDTINQGGIDIEDLYDTYQNIRIRNNRFEGGYSGVLLHGDSEVLIQNNIFHNQVKGFTSWAFRVQRHQIIENNYFSDVLAGVYNAFGCNPIVRNNTFYLSYHGGASSSAVIGGGADTIQIYNNLVISLISQYGINCSRTKNLVYNNLVIGKCNQYSIQVLNNDVVKNNNVINGRIGIYQLETSPVIQYNNSFGNSKANYSNFTPDSTNLSADPMFVSDSVFHLQLFSPLIDKGDPEILDKDGSRSDIGLFGGPYGESYTYQDLAPRPPVNIQASSDSGWITLKWNKNTESDFSHYIVYKDTLQNFTYDPTKIIAEVKGALYTELLPLSYPKKLVYKITAVDSTGNQSPAGEEVIMLTGVNGNITTSTESSALFQNYPNPFNPSTKISYRLNAYGTVSLKLYDIQGKLITELVHKQLPSGYYETEINAEHLHLSSGVYLYSLEVSSPEGKPSYRDIKKMILVK